LLQGKRLFIDRKTGTLSWAMLAKAGGPRRRIRIVARPLPLVAGCQTLPLDWSAPLRVDR
jgi:hypothetical protein